MQSFKYPGHVKFHPEVIRKLIRSVPFTLDKAYTINLVLVGGWAMRHFQGLYLAQIPQ